MRNALKSLFTPSPIKQRAHAAYVAIVAAARNPVFYTTWQVEDTLDGRFDIIVLHMALVLARCKQEGAFYRALSELFFSDMDRSLREMGVGDTGIGVRVKKMAQAFYGRIRAYEQAMHDDAALSESLRRNVWRERPVAAEAVAALAVYAQRNRDALYAQPTQLIIQGHIAFLR